MATLATIGYIALCILLFSLAIAIHEFGHFIVALKLGLRVERFSIGFGPALWKKTYNGVEYRISAIPLGGYVSIPDVDPEGTKMLEGEKGSEARERIPAWKEILVSVAGPAMNLVLAAFLAVLLSLIPQARFGELAATIGDVVAGGPAAEAGLVKGDVVTHVAGRAISSWTDMQTEVQIAGERPTEFRILRSGEEMSVEITPKRDEITGACFIEALSLPKRASGWMPARNPLKQLSWDALSIFRVLKGLVTPREMASTGKALGGPVMIAEAIYASVRSNFWDGLGFLRFLNVNLAILNLLPIPVLDGGLILFSLIALIFRRRVPDRIVNGISNVFMYLLMALMAFLIYRDSARSLRMHTKRADRPTNAIEQQEAENGSEDPGAESR